MGSTPDHSPVVSDTTDRDAHQSSGASERIGTRTAVILDGYPLWLEAVERLLSGIGVATVGKSTSPRAALALLDEHHPHLVIADINLMAEDTRLRWIETALRSSGGAKLIVLGPRSDGEAVNDVLAAGADAYVEKTTDPAELALVVKQAFEPSIFFAPLPTQRSSPSQTRDRAGGTLTRREWQILLLVSEGMPNAVLARQLWVTEQTVKFHLSNVYRKLGVSNRTQAARWARVNGVVDAERTSAVGA